MSEFSGLQCRPRYERRHEVKPPTVSSVMTDQIFICLTQSTLIIEKQYLKSFHRVNFACGALPSEPHVMMNFIFFKKEFVPVKLPKINMGKLQPSSFLQYSLLQ